MADTITEVKEEKTVIDFQPQVEINTEQNKPLSPPNSESNQRIMELRRNLDNAALHEPSPLVDPDQNPDQRTKVRQFSFIPSIETTWTDVKPGWQAFITKSKNLLLYPSASAAMNLGLKAFGMSALMYALSFFGVLNPSIGALISMSVICPAIFKLTRLNAHKNKIDELLTCIKVAATKNKSLSDGTKIEAGNLIGELHIEGANVKTELRTQSQVTRGANMRTMGLISLIELARLCQNSDKRIEGIKAFYGTSDVVMQKLLRHFGFEVNEGVQTGKLTKISLRVKKMLALGLKQGSKVKIDQINELWVSRESLIGALPKLEEFVARHRLSKAAA